MLKKTWTLNWGFIPTVLCSPKKYDTPMNRYCVIIAKSRGDMGGRVLSPPSSYQVFEFPIREKEFFRAVFIRFFPIGDLFVGRRILSIDKVS